MRKDEFIGGQFEWFTGIIKDIDDPKGLNRVKVHCLGFYDGVDTKDLPWATVVMPVTNAAIKGNGGNHHLEEGSWVVGFFRDGPSAQDPMVIGSIATQTDGTKDLPEEASIENKVYKSKAGHLIELDNTSGAERVNIQHTSGTTININSDGTVEINAVNDIVNIDGNTTITGTLHVTGAQTNDATITAQGEVTGNSVTLSGHTHTDTPGLAAGTTSTGTG